MYNLITLFFIGLLIYSFLLMISLSYSCGGYSFKECGFCWVGIVQLPLELVDWIISKFKREKNG